MKKFRIVLLTAMCLIFGVLGLSGCIDIPDDTGDSSSTGTACVHELEKHDEIEATCSEEGNVQYWTCSKCGKFFTDAEAKNVGNISAVQEKVYKAASAALGIPTSQIYVTKLKAD